MSALPFRDVPPRSNRFILPVVQDQLREHLLGSHADQSEASEFDRFRKKDSSAKLS
jgi:hypothetical protein